MSEQPTGGPRSYATKPVDPVAGQTPSREAVRKFHTNADTDGNQGSIHHTLGPAEGQASPGNHDHRGGSSKLLFEGVTISGSKASGAALQSIIDMLRDEFGITDNTTP